jgi:hypothetical protein
MSTVFIDHPDEWIGIPEDWPTDRWENAYQWASELVDVLADELGPAADDQKASLRDYLVAAANSRRERGASRIYASVDGWTSPVYLADMLLLGRESVGDSTAESLAGADDPDALEKPVVVEFRTTSGLLGVKCTRYVDLTDVDGIMACVDYVFAVPDGFVRLYTGQFDLVEFDRSMPRMDALALTVSVVP